MALFPCLGGSGGTGPTLLWTNPSQGAGATFVAQKVSLDLSKYTGVIIGGKWTDRNGYLSEQIYVPKGTSNFFAPITIYASYGYGRNVTVDATGVTFSTGATQSGEATGYNVCIPTTIYGV